VAPPINFGTIVANPDYYDIAEDGTLTVADASGVLVNDFATEGSVTVTSFTKPGHGTVSVDANGGLDYTPDAGFVGEDSFTYSIPAGILSNTATVTVDVFHNPPIATPDVYIVQAGTTLNEDALHGVLANDIAFQGTAIVTNFNDTSHGTVTR
jgi:hypothetical protein